MKNKNAVILKLVSSICASLFLIYIFIQNHHIMIRVMMLPFLICSFSVVGMSIFFLLNKKDNVEIFNKVYIISFLVYWFGFLIVFCYMSLMDSDYMLLLFSIPFWLAGIYILKKYVLKTKRNRINFSMNIKKILSVFLVGIYLLLGIMMLILGFTRMYQMDKTT